ncbi:MAG: 50S ribosomal protein L11 methyltransferase [Candidatus Delongbacteria bacterium]|nr:50S ribosomal protein L11 methyltransferase [Candidatus Delongbacteria bacterium]
MEWYSIDINIQDEIAKDVITEFAFAIGCEGIEDLDETTFEDASGLRLFFSKDNDTEAIIGKLKVFLREKDLEGLSDIRIENIPETDWREEWKKSYKPIDAGKFIVVPAWQTVESEKEKIFIEPKMAFGTGTHETTKLMLEQISKLDLKGKKVFDAGSGSGILSIASVKNGAEIVVAVDIDEESFDNCRENAELNGVAEKIIVKFTNDKDYAVKNEYDVVLANINRLVLEKLLPNFKKIVKPGGIILLSGILIDDNEKMYKRIQEVEGLKSDGYFEMGEWCCMKLAKI